MRAKGGTYSDQAQRPNGYLAWVTSRLGDNMATPRVFISSTCYDLKYIRENLKYFVRTIGYESVLSDEGDVYYNPSSHTHDSCLKEVETCQIFILIIGGRHGGDFKEEEKSITNHEYREAIMNHIPVFALVENSVYTDHNVYASNKNKNPDFVDKINYPSIDNIKIFDFIDEVRKNTENNAIYPFVDFSDIETYLKKQWAGMMYDFILQRANEESSRVTNRLLDDLTLATRKSEELIKVLLKATDSDKAEETIEKIGNKVEAENFAKLVLDKFEADKLPKTTLESLTNNDLSKSWSDFLIATNDFYDDVMEHEEQSSLVIWGPASRGLEIGHYEGEQFISRSFTDIEKAYDALRSVDEQTRIEIYKKLINGF
ncbi:MAG: DUF4062 domain-containing protein [Woeseiaceae bacterium]